MWGCVYESGVVVVNGRARAVNARVVEEICWALRYAGPLLLSYSNHVCHTPYHTARCGRLTIITLQAEFQPTQRYAIVWPLFNHTNNRRPMTLLQNFPYMEGVLPTTKSSDLLFHASRPC
jgi:hypothetical protein